LLVPCLGAAASDARASDFTITSRLSQSIEYNDNINLTNLPSSGVIGSYNTVSLSTLNRTPTTRFSTISDFSYRRYFGPGEDNIADHTKNYGTIFRFDRHGKAADSEYVSASYRVSDVGTVQREDTGIQTASGNVVTYTLGAGLTRQINFRNIVSLSAQATSLTYPDGGGATPLKTLAVSGSWVHHLNRTTDFITASNAQFLSYDNAAQTRTIVWKTTGGIKTSLTKLLTLTANAGAVMLKTRQDSVVGPSQTIIVFNPLDPLNPFFLSQPINVAPAFAGTSFDFVADAALNYRILKNTQISINAAQAIGPSALGEISKRISAGVSLRHTINRASSVALSANFSRNEAATTSDNYTASIAYNYQIARDWNASLTYFYRHRIYDSTTTAALPIANTADSNSILFVVSKNTTLKP
jgi:hypothetical protein